MKKANAWLIFQQRAGDKSSAGASSVMHLPLGQRTLSAGIDYFLRCLTKKSDMLTTDCLLRKITLRMVFVKLKSK